MINHTTRRVFEEARAFDREARKFAAQARTARSLGETDEADEFDRLARFNRHWASVQREGAWVLIKDAKARKRAARRRVRSVSA